MSTSDSSEDAAEFESLVEVATELGHDGPLPPLQRRAVEVGAGRHVSVVVWGTGPPELVFVHGGGQNARTWDMVALLLGRPAIAIDLPGHGHSSWRADRDYGPVASADAVATTVELLAPEAVAVVGMSLGGLTTIRLAAQRPELVRRAVLVDVTPGSAQARQTMTPAQRGPTVLLDGPTTFATLDEMVAAAVQASPRRPASAVRRGVIHNSLQRDDGRWAWRHDMHRTSIDPSVRASLWSDLGSLQMPVMLVQGAKSSFVTDADLAKFRSLLPDAGVHLVGRAGHAVQSDQPELLARMIEGCPPTKGL